MQENNLLYSCSAQPSSNRLVRYDGQVAPIFAFVESTSTSCCGGACSSCTLRQLNVSGSIRNGLIRRNIAKRSL